jgi:hypothetical protein
MTAGRINQVSIITFASDFHGDRAPQKGTPCVLATHDDASTTLINGSLPQLGTGNVPVHLQPLTNGIFDAHLRA